MRRRVRTNDQRRMRVVRDISECLPVFVLPSKEAIVILSCSFDKRTRIKSALDRIATIGFGVQGSMLQRFASSEAKSQVFSQVSYENVTASSLAETISMYLNNGLKLPHHAEIDGALIIVRLDSFDHDRDEVVVVSYDGSLSFVPYFLSGLDLSGEGKKRKVGSGDVCVSPPDRDEKTNVQEEEKEEKKHKKRESTMGRALPAFEAFISDPDLEVDSIFDIVQRFGEECAREFGEEIYIQCVQLVRPLARAKRFREVFNSMHDPWPVMKDKLNLLKREMTESS
ncbi:MAG: hypothetical protein HZA36_00010 [Parcubacteria group bacterium]|nr:hypothetical protein [Parcubacteria group bacterium]